MQMARCHAKIYNATYLPPSGSRLQHTPTVSGITCPAVSELAEQVRHSEWVTLHNYDTNYISERHAPLPYNLYIIKSQWISPYWRWSSLPSCLAAGCRWRSSRRALLAAVGGCRRHPDQPPPTTSPRSHPATSTRTSVRTFPRETPAHTHRRSLGLWTNLEI